MGNRRLIEGELKEVLDTFMRFNVPSKIYHYSNYVQLEGKDNLIHFTQSLIIGEAINSGLVVGTVAYEGEPFDKVTVPVDAIKKLQRILEKSIEYVEIDIHNDKNKFVEVRTKGIKQRLPLADVTMPSRLISMMNEYRQVETSEFPMEGVKSILKVLGKEITNTTVSFNLHGVYLTSTGSYTTNQITVEVMKEPLNLPYPIYMPYFATKMLSQLPDEGMEYAQIEAGGNSSPFLYMKGDGIEFFFQEWMSKDVYPVDGIQYLLGEEGVEVDISTIVSISKWMKPNSDIITIDFREGKAKSDDNEVELDIAVQDVDTITLHASLIPPARELDGTYTRASIINGSMLKLSGFMLTKIISSMA